MTEERKIEKGMLIAQATERDDRNDEVWCVTKVRQTAKGASVTLLRHTGTIQIEAGATFPGGTIRPPFRFLQPLTPKLRPPFEAKPGMRASFSPEPGTVILEHRDRAQPRKIVEVRDHTVITEPEHGGGRRTSIKRMNLSKYTILRTPDGRDSRP